MKEKVKKFFKTGFYNLSLFECVCKHKYNKASFKKDETARFILFVFRTNELKMWKINKERMKHYE